MIFEISFWGFFFLGLVSFPFKDDGQRGFLGLLVNFLVEKGNGKRGERMGESFV